MENANYGIGIDANIGQVSSMLAFGVDIGGSGIKSALVDTVTGKLVSDRLRTRTPVQADADALLGIIRSQAREIGWHEGPVGVGFPGVIRQGVIHTAVNLGEAFVGVDFVRRLGEHFPGPRSVLNDADAAGFAEMRLGLGTELPDKGTVVLLTVGTGIGSVVFSDGHLVPNLELGHIEMQGRSAEEQISERVRKDSGLSWKQWTKRFNLYLDRLCFLIQPDFLILGGGGVKKAEKFLPFLEVPCEWGFARFGNRAGIIGAAIAASEVNP